MADYIKRADAMTICERYSSHCFETSDSRGQDVADRILDDIAEMPMADVVEVVRCEKCKYGDVSTISKTKDGKEKIACYCNLKNAVTDVDGYCPSGERKDT